MKPTVLVVEDDVKLAELLAEFLDKSGYASTVVHDGRAALHAVEDSPPDVIVLDWMLPQMDGIAVCESIRQSYHGTILMLTARSRAEDQIRALDSGADDFITKPVDPRVLVARIRARLRRAAEDPTPSPETTTCTVGPLQLSQTAREASLHGKTLRLTGLEFDLLWLLATQAGTVVTRDVLYERVRGVPYDGCDRGMDIHIFRLRRKLEDLEPDTKWIDSIRGEGYLLTRRT